MEHKNSSNQNEFNEMFNLPNREEEARYGLGKKGTTIAITALALAIAVLTFLI